MKKKTDKKEKTYTIKHFQKGETVCTQITCDPLTLKALLKIVEDLYGAVLHMNSDFSKKIGFLEGEIDSLQINQRSINSNFLRIETELFEIKNKPWWKRFLGF